MTELTFTLPWPPSINSMYSQGIIGAKRNLEEPFTEVLRRMSGELELATIGDVLDYTRLHDKDVRSFVKQAFGSPRASMFLSDVGKAYRTAAAEAIAEQGVPRNAVHGLLDVKAIAHVPDKRTRDLDNLWKSALDVLKHNQVIVDDGHIDHLDVRRGSLVKGGSFVITISEIAEAFETRQQGFDLASFGPTAAASSP
jgi:crossover junction endodeoxyribonuclease RusA